MYIFICSLCTVYSVHGTMYAHTVLVHEYICITTIVLIMLKEYLGSKTQLNSVFGTFYYVASHLSLHNNNNCFLCCCVLLLLLLLVGDFGLVAISLIYVCAELNGIIQME